MNFKENKMQDKIFEVMQKLVNSKAYPYLLGCFMGATFAYLIYKGI